MNTKKVKALRRQIKYHPSEPRKYEMQEFRTRYKDRDGKIRERLNTTISIHPSDKRFIYQELKKELR